MKELQEELIDLFNSDLLTISAPSPVKFSPKTAVLSRTKDLNLQLTMTSVGWSTDRGPGIPAGTIYRAKETIEFSSPSGAKYIAKGVIHRGNNSHSSLARGTETTHIFSMHALEMRTAGTQSPLYVIEWVSNLSDAFIGNAHLDTNDTEISTFKLGDDSDPIVIRRSSEYRGGSRILGLKAGGHTLYFVKDRDKNTKGNLNNGYIVYRDCPSPERRDKIRDCVSFILGLPIVLYGYTEYSEQDYPIYMNSVAAYAFGGRVFDLHDQPPYPIHTAQSRNMLDENSVNAAVDTLLHKYNDLKLENLFWTYWHGVCAPITMSAVYFGGLVEQLQKASNNTSQYNCNTIVPKSTWYSIKKDLLAVIESLKIDPTAQTILRNKISGLNQLPHNVAVDRLLGYLGLRISDAEKSAWQHRNSAAHGSVRTNYDDIILNSKLLRLMFHRILAALTGCSSRYFDYYNLDFPIRSLAEEIPARSGAVTNATINQ